MPADDGPASVPQEDIACLSFAACSLAEPPRAVATQSLLTAAAAAARSGCLLADRLGGAEVGVSVKSSMGSVMVLVS